MVQEFHVVRCFSCLSFQSQQVCKKPKFTCRICGEKQSVRNEYGRGSGKDCRTHVQKLNSLQGNLAVEHERRLEIQLEKQGYDKNLAKTSSCYHDKCNDYTDEMKDSTVYAKDSTINFPGQSDTGHMTEKATGYKSKSKWATFLEKVEMNSTEYEDCSCASTRKPYLQKADDSAASKIGPLRQKTLTSSIPSLKTHPRYLTRKEDLYSEHVSFNGRPRIQKTCLQESQSVEEDNMYGLNHYCVVANSKLKSRSNPEIVGSTLVPGKRLLEEPQNSSCKHFAQSTASHQEEDDTVNTGYSKKSASDEVIKCNVEKRSHLKTQKCKRFAESSASYQEEDDTVNTSYRRKNTSDELMKSNVEKISHLKTQKCKSVLRNVNSLGKLKSVCLNFRDQQGYNFNVKNSDRLAFKKYELASDSDIEYDL